MRSWRARLRMAFSTARTDAALAGPLRVCSDTLRERASKAGSSINIVARYARPLPGGVPKPVMMTPVKGSTDWTGKKFKTSSDADQRYLLTATVCSTVLDEPNASQIVVPPASGSPRSSALGSKSFAALLDAVGTPDVSSVVVCVPQLEITTQHDNKNIKGNFMIWSRLPCAVLALALFTPSIAKGTSGLSFTTYCWASAGSSMPNAPRAVLRHEKHSVASLHQFLPVSTHRFALA